MPPRSSLDGSRRLFLDTPVGKRRHTGHESQTLKFYRSRIGTSTERIGLNSVAGLWLPFGSGIEPVSMTRAARRREASQLRRPAVERLSAIAITPSRYGGGRLPIDLHYKLAALGTTHVFYADIAAAR